MTRQEEEKEAANLLLEQRRLKRIGLELPPQKLSLLQRLLYRLGYTKMSRSSKLRPKLYVRLTLSSPRPALSFGGEAVNEHDIHDPEGNVVGNIRIRDRGSMLHVDWIGGKGKYAGGNLLGNEAMRSVHDAIATHYPRAEYLRGHRISGFRGREAAVGSPVVIPIRRRTKMSRKNIRGLTPSALRRYAKFNSKTPAHPLIQGFPIEFALRSVANHPQSTSDAKNLAVAALKGHTEALWGLHDELHNTDHPILHAGYNWLNAADKLHLDKHTYTALNEVAEHRRAEEPHVEHRVHANQYLWRYTPEYQAQNATGGITSHSSSRNGQTYTNVFNRVKELSPNSTDEEINESIRRHGHRAQQESQRRITGSSPDQDKGNALRHPDQNPKINAISTKNEIATRYKRPYFLAACRSKTRFTAAPMRYSLANKPNFIGSLLKASSPEHRMFVNRVKELAHRAGAERTKEFPALHDTPHQSVPGVALAVYGNIQPNSAHALGSWVNGLLPNSPGYAIFHARGTGPDTLYRIRMEGSGYDARAKLDRAGIPSRVFVPHRKGLDILIPDKGTRMSQQVQNFASQQKVPIESSPGHLTTVGSQDQAQARDTFRNKIAKVGMSRRLAPLRYAGIKVTKPQKEPTKPKATPPEEPKYDLPSRAKQDLGSHLSSKPKEFQYEPGLLPPTPTTQGQPLKGIQKLPKGVRQKEWNPTMVPPKSSPLFNSSEMNKLHQWAHNHAFTHTPAFAKFLGKGPRDPKVHNLLVKAIVHAAHEMRRTGTNSITAGLGNTGKRIKINIPRTSWVGIKTTPKTYKPPKPKPITLSRFEKRRRTFRSLSCR